MSGSSRSRFNGDRVRSGSRSSPHGFPVGEPIDALILRVTGMTLHPLPGDCPAHHYSVHLHPQLLIQDRLSVSLTPAFSLPTTEPFGRSLDHVLAVAVDHDGEVLRNSLERLDGCRHFHLVVG